LPFALSDRPAQCTAPRLNELPARQTSRPPSDCIPSLRAILAWDSLLPFPRQHNISHFISAHLFAILLRDSSASPRDQAGLKALCRTEVPLYSRDSALSFGFSNIVFPHWLNPNEPSCFVLDVKNLIAHIFTGTTNPKNSPLSIVAGRKTTNIEMRMQVRKLPLPRLLSPPSLAWALKSPVPAG